MLNLDEAPPEHTCYMYVHVQPVPKSDLMNPISSCMNPYALVNLGYSMK